jgi:O-Antigen ligase
VTIHPARPLEVAPSRQARSQLGTTGYEVAPLALVLGLAVVLAALEGGYADNPLYVSTLFMLAAAAVLVGARRVRWGMVGSPSLRLAAFALAGYTVWAYASIGWSDVRAETLRGANRTLLYAVVFLVVALSPLSARSASYVLLVFALAVAVLVCITVHRLSVASDPIEFVIGNRLSAPIGYPNGTAALLVATAWVSFGLATRTWLGVVVRSLAFGATGVLVLLALLAQSRGAVFTAPAVVVAFLAFVPGRTRAIFSAALVVAVAGAAAPRALDVFRSEGPAELASRSGGALHLIVAAFVGVAVAGFILVWVERRVEVSRRVARIGTALAVGAVTIVGMLGVLQLDPIQRADDWWHEFKSSTEVTSEASHFGGLGSNRYDFWRVGLGEFVDHPVRGIGVDNFQVPYLEQRRSTEEPLYPHSLAIDLLSQTGIIGTGLFALFLAAAGWSLLKRKRGPERELALVLAVAAFALLAHSAVDWLWEIPVLGIVGMAFVGLVFAVEPAVPDAGEQRSPSPVAARLVAGAVWVVCLLLVLGPWLAERYTSHAATIWRSSLSESYNELDVARAFNPFSERPDLIAATIAIRTGDDQTARKRLEQAVARNPSSWYGQLQLSAVALKLGDTTVAERALQRAVELNPHEPVVCLAASRARENRPLSPAEVERALSAKLPTTVCDRSQ